MYDIIIIGGGPAGLTAALYAKRANKRVLVIEKATFGGQITYSPKVENIPGFISLSGNEFAEKLVSQVLEQGAEVELAEVKKVVDNGYEKIVETDGGTFTGKSVIIATGAKHRLLGLPKEEEFIGNGISFCAVCDGAFYDGQTVAVIGGGNSALQEALLLSDLVKKLYIVQNIDYFTGEQKLVEQLLSKPNVEVIFGALATEYIGESEITGLKIREKDGKEKVLEVSGVFVAVGLVPQNEPFSDILALNKYGYAEVDETCKTEKDGIFVAGDCRSKRIRQVATACSDGAISALAACEYVDGLNN